MINPWLQTSMNFSYVHLTQSFTLKGMISGRSQFIWVTSTTWRPNSPDDLKPSNAGEGTMAIARDCHCDSVKKKCWKRFMLASCVTIAVGGQLEICNILLNAINKKSAHLLWGLRGLILAHGEEKDACMWIHWHILGARYVLWALLEGILMTHENSKILRTMTMMKTDSNDSQDSNSSKKSNEMEWMIPPWSFNHNNILTQLMLILSYSFHIQYCHLFFVNPASPTKTSLHLQDTLLRKPSLKGVGRCLDASPDGQLYGWWRKAPLLRR